MTSKTFWTWTFFATICAILTFPALIPNKTANFSPAITPTSASYTLPFTPIVNDAENPVGNITVIGAKFIQGVHLDYGNLSLIWYNGTFDQTISFARQDTSTGTGSSRKASIQISWHEYLEISKTNLISNPWFNYSSRIPKAKLISVEYNATRGWGNLITAPTSSYQCYLNTTYGTYSRYFINISLSAINSAWLDNVTNGTALVRIKYSYQIPISEWQVLENSTSTALPNMTNTITQSYHETFRISDEELVAGSASLLNITLAYIPFYREGVVFDSLWNRSATVSTDPYHKVFSPKVIITYPNNLTFVSNTSTYYRVFYKANFTIQFDQPLNPPYIYAVDRLASENYLREHWYYVKVSAGPNLLRISNLVFNDTNINYPDTIGTSTYFGRDLAADWNNYTVVTDDITNEINNGTTLTGGYFVSGETDVLILSYQAERNLTVLIADQILTPMPGANVTLFRDGIRFGSYSSRALNYSLPYKIADERGIVVFPNLPSFGNYSVHVEYAGFDYGMYYVDLYKTPNILTTIIPHFLTWIIIWCSFCGLLTVIGFSRYRHYRNVPETLTP